MAGMPEMQEHFSALAMDGGYAEHAGAFFGGCLNGRTAAKRRAYVLTVGYAENAGAFFGACRNGPMRPNEGPAIRRALLPA